MGWIGRDHPRASSKTFTTSSELTFLEEENNGMNLYGSGFTKFEVFIGELDPTHLVEAKVTFYAVRGEEDLSLAGQDEQKTV